MKAIVYTEYGSPDVLRLQEVPQPVPNEGQVLIEVRAASLNAADLHMLTADIFLVRLMTGGLLKPKRAILGADVAGRVAAVGKNVTKFKPGDEVFGNLGVMNSGSLAEFVCANESALAIKPAQVTFEQAAAVPLAAITALQGLRDSGKLQAGQKVLVNGASGGVGTWAVQIARLLGADVTAVCSTGKMDMLRALGADHVIDYTREDFTRMEQRYDLIFAANGYHALKDYVKVLTPTGIYVMVGGAAAQMFEALLLVPMMSRKGGRTVRTLTLVPNPADMLFLKAQLEAGTITPMIDRCYPLEQTADAFRYMAEGHAKGKIVITITR